MLAQVQPHEVYNLGAQSHVRVSFDVPAIAHGRCLAAWAMRGQLRILHEDGTVIEGRRT